MKPASSFANIPLTEMLRRELSPVKTRRKLLVAVSGGSDSVALLHLLLEAGYRNLMVAHFNHRLRGSASRGDAAFVKRLAAKLGLPAEIGSGDVLCLAKERGLSVETAARVARYAFLADVAARHRRRTIVLAHHGDDQVETCLFNFLRGSGAAGLAGMRPRSERIVNGIILELLRPLLGVSKQQLTAFLKQGKIHHREDDTNEIPSTSRNKLRLNIVPEIGKLFGNSFREAIRRSASIFAEEEDFLSDIVSLDASQEILSLKMLRALHPALRRRLLHSWLKRQGISEPGFAEVERTASMLAEGGPAKINLPGNRHARRRGGLLFVELAKSFKPV